MPLNNRSKSWFMANINKLWCYWLVTYAELTYWLVGTSPEGYHSSKASAWSGIDDHGRTIKHLRSYLKYSDSGRMRWSLAYHLTCLGEWQQAAQEYALVAARMPTPAVLIGQAQVELHLGNKLKAIEILGAIDKNDPGFSDALKAARDDLAEACIA